jgi:16S rRNA G527 N7-methylase RsmG
MWPSPSTLSDASRSAGYPLSPGQAEGLAVYLGMVREHNEAINLVSVSGEEELVLLHGLDFLPLLSDPSEAPLVDVGAGAGFVGIAAAVCRPGRPVYLLEPNARRAYFLNKVRARLGLNVEIIPRDLEGALASLPKSECVFTARAMPKKERVFRRLGLLRRDPHRLALFLGADAGAMAETIRPWYAVERSVPLPFRAHACLVFFRNVSRETY